VHRDLKPQNVLETRSGIVKLADFGLAGWQREMLESSGSRAAGTPQYLAPEIWSGAPASVRSDIYSLGATLFFMLTGQPPFPAQNMKEMRQAHQQAPVVFPFRQPAVIADAVKHCMAKNAADRPASARAVHDELSDALAHLTGDRRARRRRGGPTAAQESTVYSHASRMSAQAAMARLPVWAAARERLGQTLLSGSPLVVFSGAHPDAMARVLRGVVEHGTHKLFIAARCLVGAQRLGAACFEQLHLGTFPQPAWQDRVISELAPESGSTPAIPSVMELELRAQLTVAELNELLELGRRAEGKALVFLITAPPPVARTLLTHLQGTHHSFLVRHFELPEMGRLEAIDYVREWTRHATNEHMMWTDDGIRLLLHLVVTQARSLDLLMHNAIVVANHAHRRVLTTWAVAAADAHPLSLDSADGILPAWRNAPNTWPSAEMLATLKELRPQRAATAQ